jgi:membrane protein involved in D-alanine export
LTPYADFLYFGVLLYVVVPSLVQGLIARLSRFWILAATALMLIVQYWVPIGTWPWAGVQELWLVLGYAVLQYGVGRSFLAVRQRIGSRWAYYGALTLGLLPLAAVKFVPLFVTNSQVGFLGVSYLTFRCLDVVISIQDGVITSLPADQYLAFLLFFPTISSGPIDRYRRFAGDWKRDRSRADFLEDLDGAVHHVFRGFLYKFILAALVKRYWLDPAALGRGALPLASYMYAYSLYLFFDFAGYSAFAVGLSYLLGVHTPENFNLPFLARNIRDFWDRWHVSLSWWFRDHVYSRFVFAAVKGHWFSSKFVASYLGFLLSMGLMGLWHGAAWRYIIYGLYHATLLIGHDVFARWNKQRKLVSHEPLWQGASVFVTFNLVCFGLLIFSGRLG